MWKARKSAVGVVLRVSRRCESVRPFQECLPAADWDFLLEELLANQYIFFFTFHELDWLPDWLTGKAVCKPITLSVVYIWWTCVPVAINTALPAKSSAICRTRCCDSWLRVQSLGGRVAATLSVCVCMCICETGERWRVRLWYPVCTSITFSPQWSSH